MKQALKLAACLRKTTFRRSTFEFLVPLGRKYVTSTAEGSQRSAKKLWYQSDKHNIFPSIKKIDIEIPKLPKNTPLFVEKLLLHLAKDSFVFDLSCVRPRAETKLQSECVFLIIGSCRNESHIISASKSLKQLLKDTKKYHYDTQGLPPSANYKRAQERRLRKNPRYDSIINHTSACLWTCTYIEELNVYVHLLTPKKREEVQLELLSDDHQALFHDGTHLSAVRSPSANSVEVEEQNGMSREEIFKKIMLACNDMNQAFCHKHGFLLSHINSSQLSTIEKEEFSSVSVRDLLLQAATAKCDPNSHKDPEAIVSLRFKQVCLLYQTLRDAQIVSKQTLQNLFVRALLIASFIESSSTTENPYLDYRFRKIDQLIRRQGVQYNREDIKIIIHILVSTRNWTALRKRWNELKVASIERDLDLYTYLFQQVANSKSQCASDYLITYILEDLKCEIPTYTSSTVLKKYIDICRKNTRSTNTTVDQSPLNSVL
ncbi:ATP synthase complex assembly protein Atp25 [Schizosaccharomyces japonicus yFS275]|uniref:ATPase synthesis protein 25 n=1 Tax=Schizosaccharomyces japonicus (strain yFS275 / FY16936) TaxID=402676 RepID=B6JWL9_SCHJY|nr:ATP synthase complex assembly protein Atp25 [Schizosaccharomyces japonicus yFS275]EEB05770.1 ATP synthase complex assembly protein Atp25 [Schizosaccharomyces japonicus yFS275]